MDMVVGWVTALAILLLLRISLKVFNVNRQKKAGFPYVFVEEDKRIRKLTKKEVKFMSQEFKPNDPKFPFIKQSVKEKSADGKVAGYIHVKKVPFWKGIDY